MMNADVELSKSEQDVPASKQAPVEGLDNTAGGPTRVPISVDLVQETVLGAQPGARAVPIPAVNPFTLEVTVTKGDADVNVRILRVKTHNNVNELGDVEERNLLDQKFFAPGTILEKPIAAGDNKVQFALTILPEAIRHNFPTPGIYDLVFVVRVGQADGAGQAMFRRFGLVRIVVP